MPHGPLSLPARRCLLARESTEVTGAGRLPPLVRAGALVELAQHGLLTDEDGIATPADLDSGTGDPVLDGLLDLARESRPHHWWNFRRRGARCRPEVSVGSGTAGPHKPRSAARRGSCWTRGPASR
ncbi:hypothetical protein M2271_004198 [Streptomyces sp. LBL]|nr:hypothetical protein [Streptomyces sp. LBL]